MVAKLPAGTVPETDSLAKLFPFWDRNSLPISVLVQSVSNDAYGMLEAAMIAMPDDASMESIVRTKLAWDLRERINDFQKARRGICLWCTQLRNWPGAGQTSRACTAGKDSECYDALKRSRTS